jgi:chromosome segregation ATPase
VQVSGGKTETLAINEQQAEDSQYMLTNLDSNLVALLVKGSHIPASLQKTFDQILVQKRKLDRISEQIAQRQREVGELTQDQGRVRENMKALKGTAEEKTLTQRYTTQLNQQEDRFIALRKEIAELQAQLNQARQELQEMVRAVNLDEEM